MQNSLLRNESDPGMATVDTLVTADEYLALPDDGGPSELVRGRIVPVNVPSPWHGYVCGQLVQIVGAFVNEHDLGRVVSNDAGIVTGREPDTVRGADVCFYSYQRVPKGPVPKAGYWTAAPELVLEVRSPSDRWREVLTKVTEYLGAGVLVVCVIDPESETATIYDDEHPPRVVGRVEALSLVDVLPGFAMPLARLFE